MDKRLFFITGATGLVGTEVTERLLKETDSRIGVLVRAASKEDAERRLHTLWWGDEVLTSAIGERIVPIMGDLTKEGLGLNEESRMWLTEHATHLIHSAAETGVQKSKQELWRINVEGTRHVVELAKKFASRTHFVHLRSCHIFPNGDFTEASHLGGRADLIELCRIFEQENPQLPMRVDHGMTFTDQPGGIFDESGHGHNAGYTLLGRMFALGQVQGILATVDRELGIEYKQPGFFD